MLCIMWLICNNFPWKFIILVISYLVFYHEIMERNVFSYSKEEKGEKQKSVN